MAKNFDEWYDDSIIIPAAAMVEFHRGNEESWLRDFGYENDQYGDPWHQLKCQNQDVISWLKSMGFYVDNQNQLHFKRGSVEAIRGFVAIVSAEYRGCEKRGSAVMPRWSLCHRFKVGGDSDMDYCVDYISAVHDVAVLYHRQISEK